MSASKFANKRFGKDIAEKKSMFRNQVTSLITNERIITTVEKAKNLKRIADKMITLGKEGSLSARRSALSYLYTKDSVAKLFTELSDRFKERNGGYTRVVRVGKRHGDGATLAMIEILGNNVAEKKLKALTDKISKKNELKEKKSNEKNI